MHTFQNWLINYSFSVIPKVHIIAWILSYQFTVTSMYFDAWEKIGGWVFFSLTYNSGTFQASVNAAAMSPKAMWNIEHKEKNVYEV